VVGSNALAGDTFEGSPAADAIFGGGGADTVVTQGGADLVDLTHTTTSGACGGGCVVTVSCTSDATAAPVVLLETADDTKAGSSLGTGGAKCTDFIVE
jgi:Ca2+-binding RTX toxin-like protein